jgi:hypothetical protein
LFLNDAYLHARLDLRPVLAVHFDI